MSPEVRNWLTRRALVLVGGRIPCQTLLEVPEGVFEALQTKYEVAGGPLIAYINIASTEGIILTWRIRHGSFPASMLPCYEVAVPGLPLCRLQSLEEALAYVRRFQKVLGW